MLPAVRRHERAYRRRRTASQRPDALDGGPGRGKVWLCRIDTRSWLFVDLSLTLIGRQDDGRFDDATDCCQPKIEQIIKIDYLEQRMRYLISVLSALVMGSLIGQA